VKHYSRGDVEIHSELNEIAQPGFRGTKTTLMDREPSVTASPRTTGPRSASVNPIASTPKSDMKMTPAHSCIL